MTRWLRPLMLVVPLLLLGWLIGAVPGFEFDSTESSNASGSFSFSPGLVIKKSFDAALLVFFVLSGLLAGGLSGLGSGLAFLLGARQPESAERAAAAQRALRAASRGLLWGSCFTQVLYVVAMYASAFWRESWLSSNLERMLWLDFQQRASILNACGYLVLTLYLLVLYPSVLSLGKGILGGRAWAARMDQLCVLGHAVVLLLGPLSLYVLRAGIMGEENSARYYVAPVWGEISLPFVLFCLGLMFLFGALALVTYWSNRPDSRWMLKRSWLGMLSLGSGVITCSMVRITGMNSVSSLGGSGNPAELQRLGGMMLLPLVIAGILFALLALRPKQATKQPAPHSA